MTFSGLSNRNSTKCSTYLGKEKRKGLIFMPIIGKAQGWKRLQASRALDNGTLMAARSPGVASMLPLSLYVGSWRKGPDLS